MRILLFHNLIAIEKAHEILIALRFLASEKILPAPDKGAELGLIGFGLGKREPLHIEIVLFQRPRHPPPANRFLLRFQAPVRRIGDIVRIQLLRFFIPMDELFDFAKDIKEFFDTDKDFRITEFLHFCSKMLVKEPKEKGKSPCMIVFCEFQQQFELIQKAKEYGLNKYINLVFKKNFSAQVLKANMKVVGNCEYGVLLYRDKLPKFNNGGRMVFNCFDYPRDIDTPRIHPTQKSVPLLERLIELFTDAGDVVIDPCAGSGTTLLAAAQCGRKAYGFEIKKKFYADANKIILSRMQPRMFV